MELSPYFIMKNYRKTKNKKIVYKPQLGFKSRLRVEKVLAPYNVRPKMTSSKISLVTKCYFFQNNNNNDTIKDK